MRNHHYVSISTIACFLSATSLAFAQNPLASPLPSPMPSALQSGNDSPIVQQIVKFPPISERARRDRRVTVAVTKIENRDAVHVMLRLPKYPAIYVASLGFFSIAVTDNKKNENALKTAELKGDCVDELIEVIPATDEKPSKEFKKSADGYALQAFDAMSSNDFPKALKASAQAVSQGDDVPRFHNNIGVAMAMSDKFREAEAEFGRAITMQPDYQAAYINRAWARLTNSKNRDALDDASQAFTLDQKFMPAICVLVRTEIALGEKAAALKVCQTLYDTLSNDPDGLTLMADAAFAAEDYKEASKIFEKQLFANQANKKALLGLAKSKERLGDMPEALKRARAATQIDADDPEPHLVLGRLLINNSDHKAALIQFERVLELKPSRTLKIAACGSMLKELCTMHMYDEADKYTQGWIKDDPNCSDFHYNRAYFLSQDWREKKAPPQERLQEAVDEYAKALKLDPRITDAHYNKALLLHKLGKFSEAKKELEVFIRVAPNDPDVKSAKELISKIEGNSKPKNPDE